MKRLEITLNNHKTEIGGLGPKSRKVLDFVHNLPEGKFFDTEGIAAALGLSNGSAGQHLRDHYDLIPGQYLLVAGIRPVGKTMIFGHPKSIAALKASLEKERKDNERN